MLLLIIATNTTYASAQEDQWSEWVDPDNQFSFLYPSEWTAIPRENRFEGYDVQFVIDRNGSNLNIDVYNTTATATDLGAIMDRSVEVNGNKTAILSGSPRLFAGPDYTTYTVSGKPADTVMWVLDNPFFSGDVVVQNIASIVEDKFVAINYFASTGNFDKYLPIVERVIQSIKIK